MKWNHTGIKTADLKKSLHFYCDILGFSRLEDVEVLGKIYHFVGNDTVNIEIEPCKPDDTQADMRQHSGLYHLCFTVDDIEKTAADLMAKGVEFMLPVSQFRPDRKISFIRDPDGVIIQLIQYL
ncbi:MAG TPA: VOC family protein [Spirochaetota bacterium]|nr:VOC family protein [Spirochaetota bacterium]HPC41441.1 VOC family protein [Spirochaetota bacterium]HQF09176.1 VOC family protein [Spirochaetota bacterium]HQH97718.1 VOC family protein [Spirochaetota bacterium]HQJ71420.1 VOC family protein [Spirochaetota bacterium]